MTYQFHPEAQAEHLETVAYYETQQAGLGASYLAEFESAWSGFASPQTATKLRVNRIFVASI